MAPTIGEYLISRLRAHGVGHVFGIPGDYVLGFYEMLRQSELVTITTCDEQGAGFAADAYARLRGLGVVCVTYCVGGLKVANTTAEAFAEKSPVVVISGAPGMKEREKNPLLHYKVREFDTQKKVFEQLTVASTVLSDAQTAFAEIDRVLHAALRFKRPVYIELPRDMLAVTGSEAHIPREMHEESDASTLREALHEATFMINNARQPVILADVEVHRFGLQEAVLELLEKTGIPFATTILGKSVIGEQHPLYLGVYEGAMGRDDVRAYVESSDCVILLGAFMTDINLGIYTAKLDQGKSIYATSEKLAIRRNPGRRQPPPCRPCRRRDAHGMSLAGATSLAMVARAARVSSNPLVKIAPCPCFATVLPPCSSSSRPRSPPRRRRPACSSRSSPGPSCATRSSPARRR